jgi:hypothetical protein
MAKALGDRVKNFMTVNELRCFTDLGHQDGIHAPGLKLPPKLVNQVRHHGILAHGLGVQAVRAHAPKDVQVGLADNTVFHVPAIETPSISRPPSAPRVTATPCSSPRSWRGAISTLSGRDRCRRPQGAGGRYGGHRQPDRFSGDQCLCAGMGARG